MKIKEIINTIRDRKGWSFTRLGEETGRSRQNVWMVLNNRQENKTQLRSMVELLDVMGYCITLVPEDEDTSKKYSTCYEVTLE